jgi:hypothetical protein
VTPDVSNASVKHDHARSVNVGVVDGKHEHEFMSDQTIVSLVFYKDPTSFDDVQASWQNVVQSRRLDDEDCLFLENLGNFIFCFIKRR